MRTINLLNPLLLADAVALVAEGDVLVKTNCPTCQGRSLPGRLPGENGHCACGGTAEVTVTALSTWSLERKTDYWQARTLVAETAVKA